MISPQTVDQAKTLAARWQSAIEANRRRDELKLHEMMERMLKAPSNKVFLIELLDQSFRSNDNARIADQLEYLFKQYEGTTIFSRFEALLVWLFRHGGIYLPNLSVPLFIGYLRNDVSNVVIKGEPSALISHIRQRRREETRVNINIIGEAVLGEEEAGERIRKYIDVLQTPEIDYISIKISTIFSQITPLAHDWTLERLVERLEPIYAAAMENTFTDAGGKLQHKFVNLDMEEYRDVRLTLDAFKTTLSKPRFRSLHAGIVLQAYLPDALSHLKGLVAWAKARVENGGAPIKVRLVKGANREMELTEASLRGWPNVTYDEKAHSDANFKILMDYLLDPEVAPYVHTGIASHNLFDHALGSLLARERKVEASYTAEMLEGMSETAYRLLKEEGLKVILYAPTATAETFTNAIAYLVRRFDENTAEENFLRHSFGLHLGSDAWKKLVKSFDDAVDAMPDVVLEPFRSQDRNLAPEALQTAADGYVFENESDTDFVLPQNREWAESIRDKWQHIGENGGFDASPVIGGRMIASDTYTVVFDKSQYHENKVVGHYSQATEAELKEAVRVAEADPDGWRRLDAAARQKILMDVAQSVRNSRGDLIGVAAAEVGKVFAETDVEVSEAIDFLNFYPESVRKLQALEGITAEGKGVGLVVSPWNFPIAIPAGGVAAALAAGNTVILKPSSDAVLCAYRLCQCFWEAGVSKNTLQFVPTSGTLAGQTLVTDPAVDFVILTGGESTAYRMIRSRPDIHLSAETGGKDATIVTAMADRDQAVRNVVASAFNNSGQKCSATSLLVLERELYEDAAFRQRLVDAAASLEVGSVWSFKNRIGALVRPPADHLDRALQRLDGEEEWALRPSYADANNPYMLRPSIRWGTAPGDFCHMHELFGPVLSVMCADSLAEAIEIVNATGYGLTSGLESLDEREQQFWREHLLAGNLYINRVTTGAIVRRQPFGGMRKSAIGSGKKAGGYNYVAQFMRLGYVQKPTTAQAEHPYTAKVRLLDLPETIREKTLTTLGSFAYWLDREFSRSHDYAGIRGESNMIRYLPVETVLLRIESEDSLYEAVASIAAAKMAGARLHLSLAQQPQSSTLAWLAANGGALLEREDSVVEEDTQTLLRSMEGVQRIRFLSGENVSAEVYEAVAQRALYIATDPFIGHGRIEMMHYVTEQSIADSYHRYGNLGRHALSGGEA